MARYLHIYGHNEQAAKEAHMKKRILVGFVIVILLFLGSTQVFAHGRRARATSPNYLTFTFVINPTGLGYKHHLHRNLYLTGDLDYRPAHEDLLFRAGGAYLFPVKILIFRFYGGGGVQFSRNIGYEFPYAVVGSRFLFLYAEVIYGLASYVTPEYRLGFAVNF